MAAMNTPPSGIFTRRYKTGSIIYFENDKSEFIYILKSGRVILTFIKPDTGEEIKEDVRQGEFFGVKSSLGKYPREETAQTVGETVVLVMHPSDFERLVLKNPNVVRKMLRVFSNQLRRIHKMVRNVLGEGEDVNPEIELYRIGEFYYKEGYLERAEYAFKRYMEYYPDTKYAGTAMERIKAINSGTAETGDVMAPVPESAPADDSGQDLSFGLDDSSDDMIDFSVESSMDDTSDQVGTRSPLSSEMDDFLDTDEADNLDELSFEDDFSMDNDVTYIAEMYNNGMELINDEEYEHALDVFEKIIHTESVRNDEEQRMLENAHYEAGVCLMKLGRLKEALESFGDMVKNYPDNDNLKNAFFNIASIFETAKQKDKAIAYYNRVLNIKPMDGVNEEAMNKIKQLQSGA